MAVPQLFVEVDWAQNGTWVDITSRIASVNWQAGVQYELQKIQPGRAAFTTYNHDGAFDPGNTSSPYYPNVQPGREIRIRGVWNSTTYQLWRGFIDEYPQRWEDGIAGWSDITATDMLSRLSGLELRAAYTYEVLADTPLGYWPLDAPAESTQFGSTAEGQAWPPATIVNSKYGAGTVDAGSQGLLPVGDSGGTCVQLGGSGDAGGGNQNKGSVLQLAYWPTGGPLLSSSASGFAAEAWFRIAAADPSTPLRIITQTTRFLFTIDYSISVDASTGKLTFALGSGSVTTSLGYADGQPHHVVMSKVEPGTDPARCYVDGVEVATITGDPGFIDTRPGYLQAGGLVEPYAIQNIGDFALQHLAVYDHSLSATRVAAHHDAGAGFAGELSGARANRLLDYAGWTGARQVDTGLSTMAPCDIAGKDALDALQDVALAELGAFYTDGAGAAVFQSRSARYNAAVSATFGDAAGELPIRPDLLTNYDRIRIRNRWTVTIPSGASVTATDTTSRDTYTAGVWQSEPEDLQLYSAGEAGDRAAFQLARSKDPHLRVKEVGPQPVNDPTGAAWVATLGAKFGQRWQVKRRPPGAPSALMTFDVFVDAWEHTVTLADPSGGATDWQMTYQLSSTEGFIGVWQVDVTAYDQVDTGNLVSL